MFKLIGVTQSGLPGPHVILPVEVLIDSDLIYPFTALEFKKVRPSCLSLSHMSVSNFYSFFSHIQIIISRIEKK